jgi:hypothetical protein
MKVFRSLFPELSRRGVEDHYYAIEALKVLDVLNPAAHVAAPQKARWFCPGDEGSHWKWTLLAALGRIGHPGTIRIFAQRLVELQLDVKPAISLLKKWRAGRDPVLAMALARLRDNPINYETLEKLAHDAAVKACR